ncbi:MAG: polyprenyl synthetase family protein [bacterium]|nr:polyprenyl synthetase family protein [bacterium]
MWIEEKRKRIDEVICLLLPKGESPFHQALNYSLFPGGKRIRPLMCLASCEACGDITDEAYRVASAIELIHSYSLVHDDIIDQDEIRRGKQSVYKEYGENLAILVGDGLLTLAFETLIDSPDVAKEVISASSLMIEGQVEEIGLSEPTKEQIYQIFYKKTASLFSVSCVAGGIIGEGNRKQVEALRIAGEKFGLAFQIADDIADKEKKGLNILSVLSPEEAKEEVKSLINSANERLSIFSDKQGALKELMRRFTLV